MIDITARRHSKLLLYGTLACLCNRVFECRVQELIEGGASTSGLSYGDPSILGSGFIHDLHPASWYAIPTTKGHSATSERAQFNFICTFIIPVSCHFV